jgi:hypothetical protein
MLQELVLISLVKKRSDRSTVLIKQCPWSSNTEEWPALKKPPVPHVHMQLNQPFILSYPFETVSTFKQ